MPPTDNIVTTIQQSKNIYSHKFV